MGLKYTSPILGSHWKKKKRKSRGRNIFWQLLHYCDTGAQSSNEEAFRSSFCQCGKTQLEPQGCRCKHFVHHLARFYFCGVSFIFCHGCWWILLLSVLKWISNTNAAFKKKGGVKKLSHLTNRNEQIYWSLTKRRHCAWSLLPCGDNTLSSQAWRWMRETGLILHHAFEPGISQVNLSGVCVPMVQCSFALIL